MRFSRIIHLIVAIVLLVSTIGVVINKHYSGGELFSTALFVEAESCCTSSCCHSMQMEGCREEFEYLILDLDFTIPDNAASFSLYKLEISLFSINENITSNLYSSSIQNKIVNRDIKPPPKTDNLSILFHSLLI